MAKKTKITAPNAEYSGVGVGGLVFSDGVAETDNDAVINYCRDAGYGIGDSDTEPPARRRAKAAAKPPVDARDVPAAQVGSPLRDAAVDPKPEDFMPPVNAGQADPHGPEVFSTQVHGAGPGDVRPGPVSTDPDVQQEGEAEHVQAALAGELDTAVTEEGSAAAEDGAERLTDAPARNASADDWKAWARQVEQDKAGGDAALPQPLLDGISNATRAELIAEYAPPAEA